MAPNDCLDDLTAEEIPLLLKVMDADHQGVLAVDDSPQLNGEIRGSLYEFKAVCEQDVKEDQVTWIRIQRKWSDLDHGYQAFGCDWTNSIATEYSLWESCRRTAEQIRAMRNCTTNESCAPPNPPVHTSSQKAASELGESYLLCRWGGNVWHPIFCTDGLSDKESQQLIELLEGEYAAPEYQFKLIIISESDWRQTIGIRRQWHALEPFLGEFDFGLWDVKLPEEYKVYVHVNYSAAEYATELEGLRTTRPAEEEKGPDFFAQLPVVVVSILLLRELDTTRCLYPTNIDAIEATAIFNDLVARIEMVLNLSGYGPFKKLYRRPAFDDSVAIQRLFVLQTAILMWHPNIDNTTTQDHLAQSTKDAIRECEKTIPPDLAKIYARISEILVLDCRIPQPVDDQTYQDPRRFFQLLREYWMLSKTIMMTALDVPVHHQPHALTRLILNLKSRLDICFQHLKDMEDMQQAYENTNTLFDTLLSADPDDFTVLPEWTTGLIQQVEMAIEKVSLIIGSAGFPLTTAESNFIKIVREAAQEDRNTLQKEWDRIRKSVTTKPPESSPVQEVSSTEGKITTKAACGGNEYQDDAKPISDKGEWFSDDPPKNSKFAYGPLEGSLRKLGKWIGIDPRTLAKHNGKSICWIKKIHGRKYAVWFTSNQKYAEANKNRLAENTNNHTK